MAELARNWDDSLPTLCRLGGGHLQEPQGFDGEPPSWEGQTAFVAVLQAFQLQEGQPHLVEGQREDKAPSSPLLHHFRGSDLVQGCSTGSCQP